MNEEVKRKLEAAGVDVGSAMERFMGNDILFVKYAKKFLDDKNYGQILEAIEEKNLEKAFAASHTLKGVSANLSFMALAESISNQVEYFRAGDWDNGVACMPDVTGEYEKIITVLKEIFEI